MFPRVAIHVAVLFGCLTILFHPLAGEAAAKTKPPAQVSFQVEVRAPAGVDLQQVSVTLLGMSRPLLGVEQTVRADARGRVSFTVLDLDPQDALQGDEMPPCRGFYHVIAQASGTAGAVSPMLFLEQEPPSFDEGSESEWGPAFQKPIDLRGLMKTKAVNPIVLTLQPGVTVAGSVLSETGAPLASVTVRLFHDLHADSHTGYGREIFPRESVTDEQGRFTITGVFPNTCFLGEVEMPQPASAPAWFWKKTRIAGREYQYQENRLPLATSTKDLDIVLLMAQTPYRYEGLVQDRTGAPVASADVGLSVRWHAEARTYADTHSFVDGQTDARGRFALETTAPFANFIRVSKAGYKEGMIDNDDLGSATTPLVPGSLTVQLERE